MLYPIELRVRAAVILGAVLFIAPTQVGMVQSMESFLKAWPLYQGNL
jgi:hypothetical protein